MQGLIPSLLVVVIFFIKMVLHHIFSLFKIVGNIFRFSNVVCYSPSFWKDRTWPNMVTNVIQRNKKKMVRFPPKKTYQTLSMIMILCIFRGNHKKKNNSVPLKIHISLFSEHAAWLVSKYAHLSWTISGHMPFILVGYLARVMPPCWLGKKAPPPQALPAGCDNLQGGTYRNREPPLKMGPTPM